VNTYAERRMREQGDVYAWAADPSGRALAVLYVSRGVSLSSFPSRLGSIEIMIAPISEPTLYRPEPAA
jgi:hypothetical protein